MGRLAAFGCALPKFILCAVLGAVETLVRYCSWAEKVELFNVWVPDVVESTTEFERLNGYRQ